MSSGMGCMLRATCGSNTQPMPLIYPMHECLFSYISRHTLSPSLTQYHYVYTYYYCFESQTKDISVVSSVNLF